MLQDILIEQSQTLLDALWDIHRRMGPDVEEWEAYNDYYRERIEDLIGKAQERLERRQRKANAVSSS